MRHAIIMAGGAGQRLWPLSRTRRPKQLLGLISGKSLLALAVERVLGLFEPENVLIVTNAEYADAVAAAVPQLPRENIIGEPLGRDTANAVCLGACVIRQRDPEATMAVFTADHIIRPVEQFHEAVRRACEAVEARPEALATFGVRPTWPHTGLGYVHRGERLNDGVYKVVSFKEKPDHFTARRYVESGQYYWNSGMFVWKVATILETLRTFLPDSAEKLTRVSKAGDFCTALTDAYPTLQKISIDFAVMEKAAEVIVVELGCEWLDVGSWPALADVSEMDEDGNTIVAERTCLLDGERNVIVSQDDHLIALLGVDDCIVVHSKDATLVCNRNESQRLKELVDLLRSKYGEQYL